MKHKHAKTVQDHYAIEKKIGIHYSVLLTLTYCDAASFRMVDPMHNWLHGSAKHLWRFGRNCQINQNFTHLQEQMDQFVVLSGLVRIELNKVFPNFLGWTVEKLDSYFYLNLFLEIAYTFYGFCL